MADRIQSFKAICRGGLQSSENHLELAEELPGSATRLVNYEVSLFGGYRRINGYEPYDDLYPEVAEGLAEGPVLGVAIFEDDVTRSTLLIAIRKDIGTNTYSFYKHVPYDGWTKLTLPADVTRATTSVLGDVKKVRHETFNFGDGNKIIFVDGVNPAIVWDGADWHVLTSAGTTTHGHVHAQPHGGDQILDAPSVVEVFRNHIFLSGDILDPAVVCYSAPNNAFNFTATAGAGQVTTGFEVVNIKPFRDNLFVFGKNGIKKVTADSVAGFVIDNVTNNVGCIARDSVQELGGDLVFLAPDGLRPVAGTSRIGDVELETISRPIQPILSNLSKDYDLDTLNGVVVRGKSQLRYFVGDDDVNAEDSYGIIGGLRAIDSSVGWEFGELIGIRASCCVSGFVGREEYILHGDYDGVVYRQEVGNSFNGSPIVAVYQTPYYDFGDTEVRKVMRTVNTFIRAEGPFSMNMAVSYDWDDPTIAKPSAYNQESYGAPVKYGNRNIAYAGPNVIYGGVEKPIIITQARLS